MVDGTPLIRLTWRGFATWLRAIGRLDARPLADVSNAYAPFFSADSQWIGFFDRGEIKKVAIAGGPIITIGPFTGASPGAGWGDDNTIVFATDDTSTGLWRVSANGGSPTMLTTPDSAQHESDHAFPSVLPGAGTCSSRLRRRAGRTARRSPFSTSGQASGRRSFIGGNQAEYIEDAALAGLGT